MEITVSGFGELETVTANLNQAKGAVGAKGAKVIRRNAAKVERAAKQFAPVDTGALRNSITTDVEGDGRFGGLSAEIGTDIHYGRFVELGTSRTAPAAFMGPALDRVTPDFVADCQALVGDIDL